MPHKKGHDPQIKKAPSKLTGLVRNIKNSPQPPYPFIRQIGATAAFLAPVPFGKSKMVKNMASFVKQAKKAPPISKNPFTGTTKQYIQRSVDQRLKNVISGNLKSGVQQMKEYRVGGKLYGHFDKAGKLTNKYVPVVGKPGKKVSVPKSSKTKQVSYVNPRISMTKAQRDKAGY